MTRAVWNARVVAESADTVVVEGNHYFPRESVRPEYLVASSKHTLCPWKGRAHYFSLETASGERADDAAWYYPKPFKPAAKIAGRVAFGPEVAVKE